MLKSEAYVGQIVFLSNGDGSCLAEVTKINQKNIKVVAADGTTWNCHPSFLRAAFPYEEDNFFDSKMSTPKLNLGVLVRFKAGSKHSTNTPYVVIGNHGGLWRLAALGGDNGRYIRGVSGEKLEIIDFNVEVN